MSFTRIRTIVAHLFFWYGILQIALALYFGLSSSEAPDGRNAISRHLIEEFGEGMTRLFFGVALGVLCEISSKRNQPDEQV